MRTLNKTLALVLALVMVLGMFGVATAADFTDDETIQYKEAVDVMTGIGSINGMGDGTFAPTGNVTRAQAAKMVAYAVLGADIAETLPVVASSFKDVDANFAWAIPSIEYLVKEGVIDGRGDGTFDPNGNVTAYEIAKMLLVAAGYGKNGEFVGPSWALNVAIVAQRSKVFAGTKATDLNAAATREECALYCFSVLTTVGQVTYSKTDDAYSAPGNTIGKDVYTLAPDATGTDSFGRPAKTWSVDGKVDEPIATIAATPVAVYNDASYAKDFAADKYDFEDVKIVNNGALQTFDVAELVSRKLYGTGIELYNTDTDKAIELIVMTQGYLATVTKYTATKTGTPGSFELEIYNPWATSATKTVTDTTETDDLFDKMLAAGLAKDDYLIVYTEGADLGEAIMKFAPVETVTGALSTFTATDNADGFNGSVTVGGTKYTLASACVENTVDGFLSNNGTGEYAINKYLTKNVTLFTDEYGMVIGVVPEVVEETVPDMVYVVNAYIKTAYNAYGVPSTTYWAQCVDMSGAEVNYQVTEAEVKTIATTTGDPVSAITATTAGLYTVETKTDATLKVTVADFTAVDATGLTTKIEAKATNIPGEATHYFDADTIFLFVTDSGATLKVTEATGVQETDGTDTYYYSITKVGTTTNYKVDVVVVNGAPVDADPITAEDLMFVPMEFTTDTAVAYTDTNGKTQTAFKNIAFVNGAPNLNVLVNATEADSIAKAGFYTYTKDANGLYDLTAAETGFGQGYVTNVYGNLVSFAGYVIPDDYVEFAAKTPVAHTNMDATGAFVVDVPYLSDMLLNGGAAGLTQVKTIAELSGKTIAFTWELNASKTAKVITGIYVVPTPKA